jgi:hypothetical protein
VKLDYHSAAAGGIPGGIPGAPPQRIAFQIRNPQFEIRDCFTEALLPLVI